MVMAALMDGISSRAACRLCESLRMQKVLELAPMAIGDAYVPKQLLSTQPPYPMDVMLCRKCGNVQLGHVIDPKIVYGNYIYRTADSLGLVDHFKRYADAVIAAYKLPEKSLVIDIGSNDGSLLKAFKNRGMRVLGIDPAKAIAAEAAIAGIPTLSELFSESVAQQVKKEYGAANLVIANNVMANIDDLHDMMRGVKHLLAEASIFICESGYLLDLLEKSIFDNIYHEHISYFSVKPLQDFFIRFGMRLQHVEHVPTKGGSLRCSTVPTQSAWKTTADVAAMIENETEKGIHQPAAFAALGKRVEKIKNNLHMLIEQLKSEGKTIAGYGASIGVTTMLYNLGIEGSHIRFLADDNQNRQGLVSPGKHIPVKSSQSLINENIDCCIIFAWQYNQPIIERNKDFLERGGKFITLLPDFQVIDKTQPI